MNTTLINTQSQSVNGGRQMANALNRLIDDSVYPDGGRNLLLESYLLPQGCSSRYPSLGAGDTIDKSVQVATLQNVSSSAGFREDLMWVLPTLSPAPLIHCYRVSTSGLNVFVGYVEASETLDDPTKYRRQHLNTGMLTIESDTRPGGNFDISGEFNAVQMPYLPPQFQTADHSTLLKFKECKQGVRTNVPILDGITYIKPFLRHAALQPRERFHGEFRFGSSPTAGWTEPICLNYASVDALVKTRSNSNYWADTTGPNTFSITQQDPDFAQLRPFRNYRVQVDLTRQPTGQVSNEVRLRIKMPYYDGSAIVDYLEVPVTLVCEQGAPGQDVSDSYSAVFYAYSSVEELRLDYGVAGENIMNNPSITISSLNPSVDPQADSVTVISVRGAPPGVTYSIHGVYNYEYLPGPTLKIDMETNPSPSTCQDVEAVLRVANYLRRESFVTTVMSRDEYQSFQQEIMSGAFNRSTHQRYAALGFIPGFIRSAIKYGPTIYETVKKGLDLGRSAQKALRDVRDQQRHAGLGHGKRMAMMAGAKYPARGPGRPKKVLPPAQGTPSPDRPWSAAMGGLDFVVSRDFLTVTEELGVDKVALKISSTPLHADQFDQLSHSGITINFDGFDSPDLYMEEEFTRDLTAAQDSNDSEKLGQVLARWQAGEPFRTLMACASRSGHQVLYVQTSLPKITGASIGFAIEACWYGYPENYAYSGSSCPQTGWLPSFEMEQVAIKAKMAYSGPVAFKLLSDDQRILSELDEAGAYTEANFYDPSATQPSNVYMESSQYFMEQLMGGEGTRVVYRASPPEVVEKIVYRDDPDAGNTISALTQRVAQLESQLKKAQGKNEPVTLQSLAKAGAQTTPKQVWQELGWPHLDEAGSQNAANQVIDFYRALSKPSTLGEIMIPPGLMEVAKETQELVRAFGNSERYAGFKTNAMCFLDVLRVINGEQPLSQTSPEQMLGGAKSFIKKYYPLADKTILSGFGENKQLGDYIDSSGLVPLKIWTDKIPAGDYNRAVGMLGAEEGEANAYEKERRQELFTQMPAKGYFKEEYKNQKAGRKRSLKKPSDHRPPARDAGEDDIPAPRGIHASSFFGSAQPYTTNYGR